VIPDANRIGEIGDGWEISGFQLTHGRERIAAYQLGIAQRCLDLAVAWSKQRTTWGKAIATRQSIQWMIADSVVELDAARLLVYRAASMADQGRPVTNEAFVAKLYATEMAQRVTDRCLQILGGLGYTRELPIQSFYRQVRIWRIGHGTSEIHRWMIARNVLGLTSAD
jgi:acyl-CoA dehydrogenase